jgi:4-amino-4-deoxy-L-arabinose transferase-like glycosyltransferase
MSNKYQYVLLTAAACLIAFGFQGSRGLFESTEGRYAECAREMMETGNWIIPQLDYHPHWTKPPLTYWAIAGGIKLLGQNCWGVRLYIAICFILLTGVITALGTILWNRRCGFLAGLIYVSAPFSIGAAYSVNTDTLLSLWTTLAVLAYWKACVTEPFSRRRWINLFWLFLGFGFMTKGPVALLILPVILIFHFYLRKTGRQHPSLMGGLGIAAFLTLGFGWYIWVVVRYPGLLSYFFKDEIVGRVATNEFHRNSQWYYPITTYLPLMFSALLPWVFLWPSCCSARFHEILGAGRWREWLKKQDRVVFLLLWAGLPLIVFSLSSSRMPLYILPYFAAVVLGAARSIDWLFSDDTILRKATTLAIIMLAVMLGVKAYLSYAPNKKNTKQLYEYCHADEQQNAGIYAFDCGKLYGLQFYLSGKLTRVGLSPDDPMADCMLDNLIQEITQNPQHETYLVISKIGKTSRAADALKKSNISYTINPAHNEHELIVISPSVGSKVTHNP